MRRLLADPEEFVCFVAALRADAESPGAQARYVWSLEARSRRTGLTAM